MSVLTSNIMYVETLNKCCKKVQPAACSHGLPVDVGDLSRPSRAPGASPGWGEQLGEG